MRKNKRRFPAVFLHSHIWASSWCFTLHVIPDSHREVPGLLGEHQGAGFAPSAASCLQPRTRLGPSLSPGLSLSPAHPSVPVYPSILLIPQSFPSLSPGLSPSPCLSLSPAHPQSWLIPQSQFIPQSLLIPPPTLYLQFQQLFHKYRIRFFWALSAPRFIPLFPPP